MTHPVEVLLNKRSRLQSVNADLLAALELLLAKTVPRGSPEAQAIIAQCQAAIRKAKGES